MVKKCILITRTRTNYSIPTEKLTKQLHHLIIIYFMMSQPVAITCHALSFSETKPLELHHVAVTVSHNCATTTTHRETHCGVGVDSQHLLAGHIDRCKT